ncbi:175 kDa protein [Pleospora typhicola fusarivirus 1]|uniref:175 kDa protein n=1 Tax=Pleospora typhicola fusarivirus 1 TaxID=1755785 RepID=A0A0S2KPV8_9VIRU|nr:175 kDa protein [Pleospora typhicola fusarivirus 1]ALO50136.1 175 kDa protein [Pleospora typhicola fusarivirus 1]
MLLAGFLSFILFPIEILMKSLLVLFCGFSALLLVFTMAVWPLLLLSFLSFSPAPLLVVGVVTNAHFLVAFLFFVVLASSRAFIRREVSLINKVGAQHALWTDSSTWDHYFGGAPFRFVVASFDVEDPKLMEQFQSKVLSQFISKNDYSNYYQLTSIAWSRFIMNVHDNLMPGPKVWLLFLLWSLNVLIAAYVKPLKRIGAVFRYYILLSFAIFSLSPGTVVFAISVLFRVVNFMVSMISKDFILWVKWTFTAVMVDLANVSIEWNFVSRKWLNRSGFIPSRGKSNLLSVFTESIAKLAVVVSDLGLPHYIMGGKGSYNAEHVQETLDLLKDAGWPINVNLTQPSRFGSSQAYADWLVSGTDWQQGIHNRKVYVDTALDPLRVKAVEWRRTEEYRSDKNELESLARYFKSPRYNYPDLDINDVWLVIGDIFRHSRITPMNYIIKMWEKKYSLGSFMVDPSNPRKKYSRWKFIRTLGYANFKKLWRKTFEFAPMLAPVAHVSVKDESLPPRKYLADKVRTVVGSPIGQYIMSTVWNFAPNHNFRWTTTPIKVGMPLNGYWMDYVYSNHARCQIHYAGDMSDFDSTLSGSVLSMISSIRKKGFEHHKDRDRIARLIDINYKQVSEQLLNTTSSGDIYRKGTGLTTGHSSTSMDNSVGLVTLYLLAWKQITGLSAKEFKYYNELSCFGDDHILSMAGNKPAAWNFKSIQSAMSKWGVTNNLEATGPLESIPFLSKRVRGPTPKDIADFNLAGVPHPRFAVFHDRDKLVGKMVAKVKTIAPEYRLKRLVSYLSLTAHHPDVYEMVVAIINRTNTFKKYLHSPQNPKGFVVPSYKKVVADWYKPDARFPENMIDEVQEQYHVQDSIITYGGLTPLDSILGALALVPDFVNPAIFNMGYMTSLQSKLHKTISWPVQLLSLSNKAYGSAELSYLLRKTVYEFIDPTIAVHVQHDVNYSSLLIRHWIFLWFKSTPFKMPELFPVASVSRKVAQLQFILNGKVQLDSRRWSFQLHDLAVISFLSFVCIPDLFPQVKGVSFPDVNLLVEQMLYYGQNIFWKNLPPNYADTTKHLRELDGDTSLVISAPTGSGKSTALVRHCAIVCGHLYKKIIVVQPRSSIVRTVVPFVKTTMSMDASGATSGMTLDQASKIWYVTAQELLLHPSWYKGAVSNNLIIIDECHISEPAYDLIKKEVVSAKCHRVFMSATPNYSEFDPNSIIDLPLISARLYNVHISYVPRDDIATRNDFVRHYTSDVLAALHTRPQNSVILVFCTTLGMCMQMSEQCPRKSCVLSSGTQTVPNISNGMVIFSTSVADVGITLPNVDLVVTSDIGFTIAHDLDGSREVYYRLTKSDITQRAGRTGRTNNGACIVMQTPHARFVTDLDSIRSKSSVFDLIVSGIPIETIRHQKLDDLKSLLGLSDLPEERAAATLDASLLQLQLYRSNLEPLLHERAKLMELETNDGSAPRPIDNARMGILLDTSTISSSDLVRALISVVSALGLRTTANHEEREALEKKIREDSLPLIGNIKSRLPYPDPDLGEWGLAPDTLEDYYHFHGR